MAIFLRAPKARPKLLTMNVKAATSIGFVIICLLVLFKVLSLQNILFKMRIPSGPHEAILAATPLVDERDMEMEEYLLRCQPHIVHGGTVANRGDYLEISKSECLGNFCREEAKQGKDFVYIKGDVIVAQMSSHYFHFFFEGMLQLWGLHIHKTLEIVTDPTILLFAPPNMSFEMLKFIWPQFPLDKVQFAKRSNTYKVDDFSTMVMTRHNDYHNKRKSQDYNHWLLHSMRETFNIVEDPHDELFISRRGYRRAIDDEDELYTALSTIRPNLRRILPDDYSVAEQAKLFANAALIISPHGASNTNAIFSNWDKMVLIEITKSNQPGGGGTPNFQNDLQVKQHYVLKGDSPPCSNVTNTMECEKLLWDTPIVLNITKTLGFIEDILLGNKSTSEPMIVV